MATATKTYKAKSSATRAAKKEHGSNFSAGSIVPNAAGEFYFKPAAKEEEKVLVQVNNKSSIENPCAVVWDIAAKMEGERRKDIIAACEKAGIAFYTARTQYQRYRTALKESNANLPAAK